MCRTTFLSSFCKKDFGDTDADADGDVDVDADVDADVVDVADADVDATVYRFQSGLELKAEKFSAKKKIRINSSNFSPKSVIMTSR